MSQHARILITGISGYIGSNLGIYLQDKGYRVCGAYRNRYPAIEMPPDNLRQTDITDIRQVETCIAATLPDIVIHTAGLSSLKECENNQELASKINIDGTRNLIESIRRTKRDIKLVFLSSDYVFEGDRGNYKEDNVTDPKTFYGKTKAISEDDIRNGLTNYIICRTSAVYGQGGNFFDYVVTNLTNERKIQVYTDVFYSPTYIGYLLDSIEKLLYENFHGVIHIAGQEKVSRYSFASQIAQVLGKDKSLVQPVKKPSTELIGKDTSLNSEYVQRLLRNFCPSIDKALHYCFGHLISPYFYFVDERGKLIGITHNQRWEEINYVESKQGTTRGNHYHKRTVEGFYILAGVVRVSLLDMSNNARKEFEVEPGDFFVIPTHTWHTFDVIKEAKWINMLSIAMNEQTKDIYSV